MKKWRFSTDISDFNGKPLFDV